jgi:hypothetical protein
MPVTQKVILIVSSIVLQLEASGVNHHGLAKWKTSDPMTSKVTTTAIAIPASLGIQALFYSKF